MEVGMVENWVTDDIQKVIYHSWKKILEEVITFFEAWIGVNFDEDCIE